MKRTQSRQNRLGAVGWLWGGRYKLERYLYFLHRVTGLGMLLFLLFHLFVTTFFRIQGQGVWETTMTFLSSPWFKFGEYLVVLAFVYHGLNGIRLTLQESGFALGVPAPPVYPYKDSLRRKRPWTIAMIAACVLLALVFLFDFTVGGG